MLFQNSKNPLDIKVTHLNKIKNQRKQQLMLETGDKPSFKKLLKRALTDLPKRGKAQHKVFVLDFNGDIKATAVQQLREEISALLTVAEAGDEVVLRLESAGGLVHSYGLAAAQLVRIKDAGLTLTVCVDKIAASGGYMMACVADNIIAAPFAVVGSVGVVAQVPNFHDFLQKHDIDVEVFTAGKYKRTVTVFGKNDAEDKEKFQQELEQTHKLFQDFVRNFRPQLEVAKVATGEHWYGEDALARNLVDELQTSDSYLLDKMASQQVYAIHSRRKPTFAEKLGLAQSAQAATQALSQRVVAGALDAATAKLPEVMHAFEPRQSQH
ncbi:protease SohB [Faucicola atlantae]|uniref:Protease SohB n=1 Tax=Faucicola atlantae TaxID=34059 RepID=A0A1B8QL19_9GAMM|nr:protease SohB [Moraxella atlantae]OBX84310.1 protease SohB [Moraxella atlantae]